MTQILGMLGGMTGQPGTGGGQVADASAGVIAPRSRRALTKTEEKAARSNVPSGTGETAVAPLPSGGDRRKRRRAAVLDGATGAEGEPTGSTQPQLTAY